VAEAEPIHFIDVVALDCALNTTLQARETMASACDHLHFEPRLDRAARPWLMECRSRAPALRGCDPGGPAHPVGFANSGGLVFMDESAEEIPTL
jgi:hypothetical protein